MFKRWIHKIIRDYQNTPVQKEHYANPIPCNDGIDERKSMHFKLHFATGGKILDIRKFDQRKCEYVNNLYIINDDQNIGEEINKILVIEGLR